MATSASKNKAKRRSRPLSSNQWTRKQWLVSAMERQGNKCAYCGGRMFWSSQVGEERYRPVLEHIVAISRGGADVEENTVAACYSCDRLKKSMPLVDFLSLLKEEKPWL